MRKVLLPGTNVLVSRLSLGTAQLHREFSAKRRHRLLEAALACGISHFDTSPYYGFGLGESSLGRLARDHPGQATIASKIGLYPPTSCDRTYPFMWLRKAAGRLAPQLSRPVVDWTIARASTSLEQSLRRLRCETLDFLMLHEPTYGLLDTHDFLTWLEQARRSGKIRSWGLAGELSGSLPWIRVGHPLAMVIQARDSLAREEANAILESGRAMQFTYGYLLAARSDDSDVSAERVLRQALIRNATGSIIVSSRSEEHLASLARITA